MKKLADLLNKEVDRLIANRPPRSVDRWPKVTDPMSVRQERLIEKYDYSTLVSIRGRTLDKVTFINFNPEIEMHRRIKDAALRSLESKNGEVMYETRS